MKKHLLVSSLFIALTIGILSVAGCSKKPGTIEGSVRQAESGAALAKATIAVFTLEEAGQVSQLNVYNKAFLLSRHSTDENGAFSFPLEEGNYLIEVWVDSQKVASHLAEVKSGRTLPLDFEVTVPSP
jgi:hypothetical protein